MIKYKEGVDYGLSNDVINRIIKNDISVNTIIEGTYKRGIFDDFEQMLLDDFAKVMK